MTHKITFRDVETGWHNALPLGNGKMGAMVWYEGRALHIALNHYDCYYQVLQESGGTGFDDPALRENRYEELKSRIDRERQRPGYDRSHYARTINPPSDGRPLYTGGSYPQGGEITVHFAGEIDTEHTLLELCIEEAKVTFAAGDKERRIGASVWVAAGCDCVMAELSQTEAGLWETPRLTRQNARGQGGYEYEDIASESGMLTMRCRFRKSREAQEKEPFVQETAVYFPDQADGNTGDKTGLLLTASVQPGAGAAERMAETGYRERDKEAAAHREEWRSFWKSTVSLPDRYLETLWHLYVYLLGCCSGAGSIYSDQACGLSGLWDIRRPCMWGSMWYWDVNIQTAFYGAFGSNHMEQAKVFCDAFLSYREKARRFAERIYGTDGWALDYPHMFYNCIQPWCALFLWNYYAYTLDEDFLKDRAYPAFKEILDFYRKMGRTDEKGIRHLDYDICPEQGPAASDTVITTAALKQLTVYALRSAEILGRPEKEKEELREMISQFPAYPLTGDGRRWKDSAAVQDDIHIAVDLLETLEHHKDDCVGMAANMIGVNKRIIVFDNQGTYMVMFNPEIIKKSGPYNTQEGCLSLAGIRPAKRWKSIKVRWQNEKFQEFVKGVLKTILSCRPADVDALMACKFDGTEDTVEVVLKEQIFKIGEKISIRRFVVKEGVLSSYIHGKGTMGVVVVFDADDKAVSSEGFAEYAKNIALQLAANPCEYVDRTNVPESVVNAELEIVMSQIKNDPKNANKPDQIIAKMAQGKMGKYYEEHCLVDQAYVKEDSMTVAQYTAQCAKEFGGEGRTNPRVKTALEEEWDGREYSIKMTQAPLSISIFSYQPYTKEELKEIARKKAEKARKEKEAARRKQNAKNAKKTAPGKTKTLKEELAEKVFAADAEISEKGEVEKPVRVVKTAEPAAAKRTLKSAAQEKPEKGPKTSRIAGKEKKGTDR